MSLLRYFIDTYGLECGGHLVDILKSMVVYLGGTHGVDVRGTLFQSLVLLLGGQRSGAVRQRLCVGLGHCGRHGCLV